MSAAEIVPNLFLASYEGAKALVGCNDNTCVVNCTKELPSIPGAHATIRVSVNDDMSAEAMRDMFLAFTPVTTCVHDWLQAGHKVIVHCRAGQQRSPAIVVAYLMSYMGADVRTAVATVRAKKPDAFFWQVNFRDAIERFAMLRRVASQV